MYTVRRPVQNLYLVRERDRRRTRELLALGAAIMPPTLVLFAAIWANLETVRLGYRIDKLQKQKETLVERHRQLLIDRAEASALARVEPIARELLGLGTPKAGQVILARDRNLALPAPLAGAGRRAVDLIGPVPPPSTEEGF